MSSWGSQPDRRQASSDLGLLMVAAFPLQSPSSKVRMDLIWLSIFGDWEGGRLFQEERNKARDWVNWWYSACHPAMLVIIAWASNRWSPVSTPKKQKQKTPEQKEPFYPLPQCLLPACALSTTPLAVIVYSSFSLRTPISHSESLFGTLFFGWETWLRWTWSSDGEPDKNSNYRIIKSYR